MSIAETIKKTGRGKKGAVDLTRDEARTVFTQILDGEVSDLELGAFCMAMRIKGETAEEMAGFLDALEQHQTERLRLDIATPVVVLPSYNGARKTPNWVPLLALLLSDMKIPVLVHGVTEYEKRTTTFAIFQALGLRIAASLEEMRSALEHCQPVFVPLSLLSPGLQRLLDVRKVIGLRNFGHVLAKLINPLASRSLPVSNYTHPVYPQEIRDLVAIRPANYLVMRGHEGEPIAGLQRLPALVTYFAENPDHPMATEEMQFTPPSMQPGIDAVSTAAAIREIRAGHASVPEPIAEQARQIQQIVARMFTQEGRIS